MVTPRKINILKGQDVPIRPNKFIRELDELVRLVEEIEADLTDGESRGAKDEDRDEFSRLKLKLYEDIYRMKDVIRLRHSLQQSQGNGIEVIRMGKQVNDSLTGVDADFVKLREIFKKHTKHKKKYGEVELDKNFKELQLIKQEIETCRTLHTNGGQFSETEIRTLTDHRHLMAAAGILPPSTGHDYREPTQEEKEAMGRWADRDRKFDENLGEIGEIVDRLGDVAITIGEKANRQGQLAVDLCRQADEANEELVAVNGKIKRMLAASDGMHLVLKLLLTLVLIGMIFWIMHDVTKRVQQ